MSRRRRKGLRFRPQIIDKELQSTLTAVLIGIVIVSIYALATYNDNHYTRTGEVTYVSPFCYELTDATGHSFGFYTNDIFKDGTVIEATLDNKGSVGYIYDDEVIDYKIIFDSED